MNDRVLGALQYPALLVIWSIGAVFAAASFYPADAALVRYQPVTFEPLQAMPRISDERALGEGLQRALLDSELIRGDWQREIEARLSVLAATPPVHAAVAPEVPYGPPTPMLVKTIVSSTVLEAAMINQEPPVATTDESSVAAPVARADQKQLVRVAVNRDVHRLKQQAHALLAGGHGRLAYQMLMGGLAGAANDSDYLGLLAVAALGQERIEEALLVYQKLIEFAPDDSRWWAGLAACQERLGVDARPGYQRVAALAEEGSSLRQLALNKLRSAQDVG